MSALSDGAIEQMLLIALMALAIGVRCPADEQLSRRLEAHQPDIERRCRLLWNDTAANMARWPFLRDWGSTRRDDRFAP
jgi:hypothetical protein